jgi:hypothetical protein
VRLDLADPFAGDVDRAADLVECAADEIERYCWLTGRDAKADVAEFRRSMVEVVGLAGQGSGLGGGVCARR